MILVKFQETTILIKVFFYNLKPYEFIYFDKFNNKVTKNFDESIL